jgi:hypothetical protein
MPTGVKSDSATQQEQADILLSTPCQGNGMQQLKPPLSARPPPTHRTTAELTPLSTSHPLGAPLPPNRP